MAISRNNNAVVFDNSFVSGASQTKTGSYTAGSGVNRLLVVYMSFLGGGTFSITSIKYNSVSLTNIAGTQIYYLVNPTSGANNIDTVINATANGYLNIFAADYANAKQTGVPDSFNNTQTGNSPRTLSTTVVAAGSWLFYGASFSGNSSNPISTNNGVILQQRAQTTGGAARVGMGDSNAIVPTGSQSVQLSETADAVVDFSLISFAPDASPSNASPLMLLL